MDDLFSQNMECLKLVSVELTESNKIKFTFEPYYAKKVSYSTDSTDPVELFPIHFRNPVPAFTEIKIKAMSQNLSDLNSHGQTKRSIFFNWLTSYRVRLAIQDDVIGDNMSYCELDNGEIYPFCCLMRDFREVDETAELFLVKFLVEVRTHVEKIDIFDELRLTYSNDESLSSLYPDECFLLSETRLSFLNRNLKLSTPLVDVMTRWNSNSDQELPCNSLSIKPNIFYPQKSRGDNFSSGVKRSLDFSDKIPAQPAKK
jgi:hypothetical protein